MSKRNRTVHAIGGIDGLDSMLGIGDVLPDGGYTDEPPPIDPAMFIKWPSGEVTAPPEQEAPAPAAPKSTSGGQPAPAKPVKEGWALGDGRYILQSGNTLWGLARTYLLAGTRYKEIWAVQSPEYKAKNTPDKIKAGDVIAMPAEAIARAKSMGLFPGGKGLGVSGGVPTWLKVVGGAAAVVGGGYLASKGI